MHIPDRSWESTDGDCYGGQATVSQCTYKGRQVAIKVPDVYLTNFDSILSVSILLMCTFHWFRLNKLQGFCREAIAWKHLQHPNILPLLGVTLAGQRFAMVSEWMVNGKICDFIQDNPNVNRTELVRPFLDSCRPLAHAFSSLMLRMVWHIYMASTLSTEI